MILAWEQRPQVMAAPLNEEQLLQSLEAPWDSIITKDARQEWAGMDFSKRSGLHQRWHTHDTLLQCWHQLARSITSKLPAFGVQLALLPRDSVYLHDVLKVTSCMLDWSHCIVGMTATYTQWCQA